MLYYEDQSPGLGQRYAMIVVEHIRAIGANPYFRLRYMQVRCVPMLKFPFMIHYSVIEDRNVIRIHAIIHTSRNPESHWNKNDWQVSEEVAAYLAKPEYLEFVPISA